MSLAEKIKTLKDAKAFFESAKKDHPEEYEIIIKAASGVLGIIRKDDLSNLLDLEYQMLDKDEALQIATALIRKTREEQDELKGYVEDIMYVIKFVLKSYLKG